MAEMLIQSESLTPIADQIRVLSGTTEPMGLDAMESHVGEANTDVATEADLIAQITNALEGKVSGGNSGSDILLQTKTVTPTMGNQRIEADSNYDGLQYVVVNGDADLKAENIKSGVDIFGVTGTYTGSENIQTCNVSFSFKNNITTCTYIDSETLTLKTISLGSSVKIKIPKPSIIVLENRFTSLISDAGNYKIIKAELNSGYFIICIYDDVKFSNN